LSKIEVNTVEPQCGTTLTLGASGDTVTLGSGASQSGFGRSGSVDWQTSIKTSGFTAVSGEGYFCNTTSAAFTVTLPASPSAGDIVSIKDYANTFDTNALTIGRNSSNIGGAAEDSIISTEGIALTLVYADVTKGWLVVDSGLQSEAPGAQFVAATGGTITTCGNFKIHSFTGPGTFTVTCAGNAGGSNSVDYLVVAGGGSGGSGSGNGGGGGGAGGYRESSGGASGCYSIGLPANSCVSAIPVTATDFPITVGGGGASIPNSGNGSNTCGNRGSNSVFSTITSNGGGGGGNSDGSITNGPGGSGGGAAGGGQCRAAGTGNTPPVSPSQGNPGGAIAPPHSPDIASSGGGGASQAGQNNGVGPIPQNWGTNGGIGATSSISGSARGYAGGGGGSSYAGPGPANKGNTHSFPNGKAATPGVAVCAAAAFGGGEGGNWNNPGSGGGGESGGANKGAGGGGTGYNSTGAGGSGIVIIRYKFQ